MASIKWPGGVFSADADDLATPIREMLVELRVLERPGDETTLLGTPPSMQAITSGATTVAKGWTVVLAAAGGGGALAAGLKAIGVFPGTDETSVTVRAAFMIASAVTLAAALVAISVIVRADVAARATASEGQYAARARIAEVMLTTIGLAAPQAVAPVVAKYVASVNDSWVRVDRFELEGNELVVYIKGQRYSARELRGIVEVDT